MINLLILLAFSAPTEYKTGCQKASKGISIAMCVDWSQYRQLKDASKVGLFQMGCRSQLLAQKETNIIEKCNALTKKRFGIQ